MILETFTHISGTVRLTKRGKWSSQPLQKVPLLSYFSILILQYFGSCHRYIYSYLCTSLSHLYPRPPPPPPHLRGWAGLMTFQSPGISPALWGQADGNNPALSPTVHNRKSHWGKGPNVKPLAILWHCRDNQKVIALHLSPAISWLSP